MACSRQKQMWQMQMWQMLSVSDPSQPNRIKEKSVSSVKDAMIDIIGRQSA